MTMDLGYEQGDVACFLLCDIYFHRSVPLIMAAVNLLQVNQIKKI